MLTKEQAVRLFTEPGLAISSNHGGNETVYHVQSVVNNVLITCYWNEKLQKWFHKNWSAIMLSCDAGILSLDVSDAVIDIPSPLDELDEHFGAEPLQ